MESRETLPPGTLLLERFEIVGMLGRGGFGITYKAHDLLASQDVAVKEFLPDFCAMRGPDGQVIPREGCEENFLKFRNDFDRESEALSRFNHPNIVRVLERFYENNSSYMVLEFVEGEPLDKLCNRTGSLPTEAAMLLAENLVDAVTAVHDQGLVHRDIKPGNIILATLSEPRESRLPLIPKDILLRFGRPVLLDFGAAREFENDGRTMTGIYSPSFGAPEQARERGRQDGRTDLYGLGATLYFCLAGEAPQPAHEREGEDMLAHASQRFAKRAPPSFLRAIDRSLQLRPEYRPHDVRTMRGELFGDLQIEGWSMPSSEFGPLGPGLYGGGRPDAPRGASARSVRLETHKLSIAALIVAALLCTALFSSAIFGPNQVAQPAVAADASSIDTSPASEMSLDKNIDFADRRLQASKSTFNEIDTLRASRKSFSQTPGMVDLTRQADDRIAQYQRTLDSDRKNALAVFRALFDYAKRNPTGFAESTAKLERAARADANLERAANIAGTRTLVEKAVSNNALTEQDVDVIWRERVEMLN